MEQLWWYVARTTGLAAWAAAAGSILVGLCMSTGVVSPRKLRSAHNWLAGITVSMVALHLTGLLLDSYVQFDLTDLLVPGGSSWRPGAVAWGIASLYVLVAVIATSLLRRRLSTRAWRSVHALSFVLYWMATVHAVTAGSDLGIPVVAWTVIGTTVVTTVLLLVRLGQASVPGARARLMKARAHVRETPVVDRSGVPGLHGLPGWFGGWR